LYGIVTTGSNWVFTIKNNSKFACSSEDEKTISLKKKVSLEELEKGVIEVLENICWMLIDKIEVGDPVAKRKRNNEWTGV